MLTPHSSAASGMVAPPSITSTTRLRKSSEYGFAIHAGLLPVASLNHIRASMGIPDSAFSGNALVGGNDRPAVFQLGPLDSPRTTRRAAAQRVDRHLKLYSGWKRL